MYGHVETLAKAEAEGIKAAGGTADLYRIEETLPDEVLSKMYAPKKSDDIPTLTDPKTLEQYDAFLFGIPTRYGNFPAQWRAFWDKTGGQWQTGALWVCEFGEHLACHLIVVSCMISAAWACPGGSVM